MGIITSDLIFVSNSRAFCSPLVPFSLISLSQALVLHGGNGMCGPVIHSLPSGLPAWVPAQPVPYLYSTGLSSQEGWKQFEDKNSEVPYFCAPSTVLRSDQNKRWKKVYMCVIDNVLLSYKCVYSNLSSALIVKFRKLV